MIFIHYIRIIAFALCLLMGHTTAAGDKKKPNVIILLTDDQNFNTIAALGNNQALTLCTRFFNSQFAAQRY